MPSLVERLRVALAPRYEVQAEIATGGMAVVFRAVDTALGRPVAVKVLRPDLATATAEERFQREARTLASFSHPNVVAVHDVGETDGISYYVMDLVEGETLAERLKRGPLDGRDSFRLGRGVLNGLERIHEAGVVHRDVKPSNIFLVGDRVLLADFGVAHLETAADDSLTSADGPSPGTPAYMAPEQTDGDPVGPATDLYALALVLYEAICGRRWPAGLAPEAGDWRDIPLPARRALRRALARRRVFSICASYERSRSASATMGPRAGRRPGRACGNDLPVHSSRRAQFGGTAGRCGVSLPVFAGSRLVARVQHRRPCRAESSGHAPSQDRFARGFILAVGGSSR